MPDDYLSTTQTTGAVEVDGSATGDIETGRDRDWFAVTLEAGRIYRIDLEGSRTGGGTLSDPYLYGIYNANGHHLNGTTDDDEGAGFNSRLYFTTEEAGTYYVAAGAYGTRRGTYTLTVTDATDSVPDDFATGTGTSGAVAVDGSARGEIDYAYDRDWFAVTLEAGKSYLIDLEGRRTGDDTLYDPYLYGVHDANGDLLAGTPDNNRGEGLNSRVTFTAEEAGVYYVAAGADGRGKGTYTLSVTEIVDDFEDGTGTSGAVEVGGSAAGEIETGGDRDWFAVTLEAGRTYRIDLKGSSTGAGTLDDPYLCGVYDAAGVLLAGTANDNGGAGYNSRVYLRAEYAGAYYVAAGADGRGKGTYTLSVTEVPDDFGTGTGTSGAVEVGGSATGEIEFKGDRDWFAVELDAGKTYRIDLEGSETEVGTLDDPYLRGVYDAISDLLADTANNDGGAGRNSWVYLRAEYTGAYYVAAGAHGGGLGTYTLSVTEVADDFEDGTGTSGSVEVGGSATGEIEFEGDHDWFAVELEAGRTYRIDLEGYDTGAGTLSNPYLYGVRNANGNRIANTTNDVSGAGRNSRVEFTADGGGTYYVAAGASGDGEGTYTLSVSDFTDDFAAETGTRGVVEVGGSATGEIDYGGDRDWFAVTLEAGKSYRIDLEGQRNGAGTLWDPYLRGVYDADGDHLAGTTNDNGGAGRNSRVYLRAEEDATYYVAAGANGDGEGTYKLSVRVEAEVADDFSAGTGASGAVEVGGSATGDIEFGGDRDWFAVDLAAGRTYQIDLKGWWNGDGTLFNPYLYGVHDANGVLLAGTTNDNGGEATNSRLEFTAEDAGTYYVAASAHGDGEGTYKLSVADVTDTFGDDYSATTGSTSGAVEVGGSATGEIESRGDRDWFAVMLEAGRTYQIDLEGSPTGNGTLRDPYLRGIYDADGNFIAGTTDDDGGEDRNSYVEFTAVDAGAYYVAAGAYGSREGTYTLTVVEESM